MYKGRTAEKGCISFNKIKDLVKVTDKEVSAKGYFNNARCMRMLGEYNLARKKEPKNPDMLNEIIILDQELKEHKEKEINLTEALMDGKTEHVFGKVNTPKWTTEIFKNCQSIKPLSIYIFIGGFKRTANWRSILRSITVKSSESRHFSHSAKG